MMANFKRPTTDTLVRAMNSEKSRPLKVAFLASRTGNAITRDNAIVG